MIEIKELCDEAYRLIPSDWQLERERARSYWRGHLLSSVDKDNEYVGNPMFTMESTLRALEANEALQCVECQEEIEESSSKHEVEEGFLCSECFKAVGGRVDAESCERDNDQGVDSKPRLDGAGMEGG